jgi:hypothetical protein
MKFLALCPCPRCLVKKDQIGEMGTKLDARRRENGRVDNDDRRRKVEMTRGWIFERGYGIAGIAVQRILSPMSLVPTRVCIQACITSLTNFHHRMPFLSVFQSSASTFIQCLLLISSMSLSLVYGRPFLPIC